MEEKNILEAIVTKDKMFFPKGSRYNDEGEFTIITFSVEEVIQGKPKKHPIYGTITVKGNMPRIVAGKKYHLVANEVYDETYKNYNYEVNYIGDRVYSIDNKEDIKTVLLEVTSENNVNKIMELENIVDILKNKDTNALQQVKGIGESLSAKIIEKFSDKSKFGMSKVILSRMGLSERMIEYLRIKYSNYDLALEKVKKNPYMLADEVKGIGFLRADALAKKFNIEQNSPFRIAAFVSYYLNKSANEGRSFVSTREVLENLRSNTDKEFPIAREVITETFNSMKYKNELWWNDNKSILALPHIRKIELEIANHLMRLMSSEEQYDMDVLEPTIKTLEKRKGFNYTNEQREGIKTVMESPVVVVTGKAGTGKTSVLEPMTEILIKQQGKKITQCALSGKASQRMAEVTGYPAATVHTTLQYNPKFGGFLRGENYPLETDVIVWDEFSMADAKLVLDLLKATKTGTKLCLVGDNGQLPNIGFGDVLLDLINSGIVPVVELTQIHRQAQASAIITESIKTRNLNHIVSLGEEGHKILGELQDLEVDTTKDKTILQSKVIKYFKEALKREKGDIMEVQVVVATRTRGDLSTFALNNLIKDIVNPYNVSKSGVIQESYAECVVDKTHKYKVTVGDKIIITKNNRKVGIWNEEEEAFEQGMVCNGNIGIVKKIELEHMLIEVYGVGLVMIGKKNYNTIELGYAITTHKSQGSQFNSVMVAIDSGAYMMLCCELLYTAITRAKNHCVLVGETKAIRRCCSVANGNNKQTFLPSFLEKLR